MKHLFIINPVAGKGKAIKYLEEIPKLFIDKNECYEIVQTSKPGEATKIVREKTSVEDYIVYSIGGDGTLNEVLNGIVNSNSILAVIPSGSGNDFARTIYGDLDNNSKILSEIINGDVITVDLGRVNNRYFLNISSIGIDAVVVKEAKVFKENKFISGSLAYLIALFKTAITFKSLDLTFLINNKEYKDSMYLIAAANGKFYGGGIKIAPLADIQDGMLDIYAIKKPKLHRLIKYLPKVLKGEDIRGIDEVNFVKCKEITVISKNDTLVNIDGEVIKSKEITFSVEKKMLRLKVPKIWYRHFSFKLL